MTTDQTTGWAVALIQAHHSLQSAMEDFYRNAPETVTIDPINPDWVVHDALLIGFAYQNARVNETTVRYYVRSAVDQSRLDHANRPILARDVQAMIEDAIRKDRETRGDRK